MVNISLQVDGACDMVLGVDFSMCLSVCVCATEVECLGGGGGGGLD